MLIVPTKSCRKVANGPDILYDLRLTIYHIVVKMKKLMYWLVIVHLLRACASIVLTVSDAQNGSI